MASETKTINSRGKEEKIRMCLDLLILVLAIGALATSLNNNGGFSFSNNFKNVSDNLDMNIVPVSEQLPVGK